MSSKASITLNWFVLSIGVTGTTVDGSVVVVVVVVVFIRIGLACDDKRWWYSLTVVVLCSWSTRVNCWIAWWSSTKRFACSCAWSISVECPVLPTGIDGVRRISPFAGSKTTRYWSVRSKIIGFDESLLVVVVVVVVVGGGEGRLLFANRWVSTACSNKRLTGVIDVDDSFGNEFDWLCCCVGEFVVVVVVILVITFCTCCCCWLRGGVS